MVVNTKFNLIEIHISKQRFTSIICSFGGVIQTGEGGLSLLKALFHTDRSKSCDEFG